MSKGVFTATKKDGTPYFRAGLNYKTKHISLGSFPTEQEAACAYLEATQIVHSSEITIHNFSFHMGILSYDKMITLLNFRDNNLYFRNPIYLRKGYFSYFLTSDLELKFDIDDLFYYSSHRIQKRQGHLFVNDYGMQYSILSRYGIRPYAVAGKDYLFANGDSTDFRYANIILINRYHGVSMYMENGVKRYKVFIHINGNFTVGVYSSEEVAAIAYNKAADLAKSHGIHKNFPENYVESCNPKEYAEIYTKICISQKYLDYLSAARCEKKS